jgi:hypothetical protein
VGFFLLKLGLTPALIGLATVVSRRWGPAVGGWLIALPFNSGPVLLFLALEQGPTFAADAAAGALAGSVAVAAFALAYAWLARRWPWWATFGAACAAFAIASVVMQPVVGGPFALLLAAALAAPVVGLRLLPPAAPVADPLPLPWWEVPLRMAVGAALVVGITAAATTLGPSLSGLLATFPVFVTVLAVFTHRREGPGRTVPLLRGVLVGMVGTVAFLAVLHVALPTWQVAAAFAAALVVVAAIQVVALGFLRRGQGGLGVRWPRSGSDALRFPGRRRGGT